MGSCSDESSCGLGGVFPLVGETAGALVVPGESVDSGLDVDESVLGVFVLSELLQVLADADGLLDHAVDIFGELGGTS